LHPKKKTRGSSALNTALLWRALFRHFDETAIVAEDRKKKIQKYLCVFVVAEV